MRNVVVLSVAQALSASGMMTMTLLGGILGSQLAPSPQLATLPVSIAALVFGSNLAFQQQHRFAAAESVPPGRVSTAVSVVMIGTLVAAALGPQVALALEELVPGSEYAGSFLGVAALCVATALVLTRYRPGPAMHALGWTALNLAALPPTILLGLALAAWPVQRSRNSRA